MRILHILPEFEEGGVERHVLMLAGQQNKEGHDVFVVSAGGKLISQLGKGITHLCLPVHKKNPVTGVVCAFQLNSFVRKNAVDVIHAHSRVPAWIAMFTGTFSGRPYLVTAHALFSTQNRLLYIPYRKANVVVCVSNAVKEGMKNCYVENTVVVRNGLPPTEKSWIGSGVAAVKFLFIGRLTELKGLQDIIKILPDLTGDWRLDVIGDGPLKPELEKMVKCLDLEKRVIFHGFRNDPDAWMEKGDCLLFPSYIEGMPLTLARAVQIGIPVIASDIEPIRELVLDKKGLIRPGDLVSWKKGLESFLQTKSPPVYFDQRKIHSIEQMTDEVLHIYRSVIKSQG